MGHLSRRGMLAAAAATGVAATVAGCEPDAGNRQAGPPGGPAAFDPADWTSVRAQFPLDRALAHLATFVFASHPAPVRAAVERHRAGLDADPVGYLHAHEARLDAAVTAAAAGYLGVAAERIAFTDSTTMGLGLLYAGLRLSPGDEVLTTEHDFYATHEALRLRAGRDGVRVRRARLYAAAATATVDEIVGNLTRALRPRTRVVAITWVHSGTGVKLPVRAIADALRGRDVLLCVDAVHGFGAEDAGPDDLGCDFLVSGGHKWLLGPRGTGLVCGTERGWARYVPVIPPFDGASIGAWLGFAGPRPAPGVAATPGGYHSFEHRWALAEAFELHRAIGRDRVAARTRELAGRLKDGLAGLEGVRLVTPRDPALSAGVVCCEVAGVDPGDAVHRLRAAKVVASATPYNPSYLRFGATIANGDDDVEAALREVRALS